MQVTTTNNVKIYNLSSGKSLPEWISERKRRRLQKKDVDVRKRIELIQDFEMPGVSNSVKISRDGKFILATGTYKPRIRCYDVNNLSMKFERCFNAEAVQFEILSDDYSKLVLLQCDRNIEFHAQYGSYFKIRVPKFGRDLAYHYESTDLLVVGASSEIYRLNLEQGRFLSSYHTEASSINKVVVQHSLDLIACGTMEGTVEMWDPRMRQRVAILDCALSCMTDNTVVNGFPSISSMYFKEINLAVGTYTGQILLYDIRTNKPFRVKDHTYESPIKNIEFIKREEDLVVSADLKCVKFWNQKTGKPYITIQSPVLLNDLCIVPDTGLLFLANEDKKILTYFIPSIGPAPQWCCFLDSITEELEESKQDIMYDDYKFITKEELQELHLEHLRGTNYLRAYMHGYFMDIRLYNKTKAIVNPTAYKDLKKKMVRNKIEMERKNQIVVKELPNVNKEYAQKLLEKKASNKLKDATPLEDPRFKDLFENPDFMINEADEEYARVKPTVEKAHKKTVSIVPESEQINTLEEEERRKYDDYTSSSEEASEDEEEDEESEDSMSEEEPKKKKSNKFQAVEAEKFSMLHKEEEEDDHVVPIGERLKQSNMSIKQSESSSAGNKVVTFTIKKEEKKHKREEEKKAHLKERAQFRRPAKYLRK